MTARQMNESHKSGLLQRVREKGREIRAAVKAGDIALANTIAAERKQFVSMAMASGCNVRQLTAALR